MAYDVALAARLREVLAGTPDLTERAMFGGLAFLVHGSMAVAVSGHGGLLLRVPPGDRDALLAQPHTDEFVMRGRAMAGWIRVEPDGLGDDLALERWAGIGVSHAETLPRE